MGDEENIVGPFMVVSQFALVSTGVLVQGWDVLFAW